MAPLDLWTKFNLVFYYVNQSQWKNLVSASSVTHVLQHENIDVEYQRDPGNQSPSEGIIW